jgi:7-cyano-7-deazaguanine reductase
MIRSLPDDQFKRPFDLLLYDFLAFNAPLITEARKKGLHVLIKGKNPKFRDVLKGALATFASGQPDFFETYSGFDDRRLSAWTFNSLPCLAPARVVYCPPARMNHMNKKDRSGLTALGSGRKARPSKKLEAFPNRAPDRYYLVELETEEFTCLCPVTGQPDFARLVIRYVPDEKVVESKSLKLYLWSFREEGHFHEHVVNAILDDLVRLLDPHWCLVAGRFHVRGGIAINVYAESVKTPEAREQYLPYGKENAGKKNYG